VGFGFGLLGPLRVSDGGRTVSIPAAKQRVLLACLLLRAGELVTVDELAEAIWGDALPAQPRRVVQTYVTRLRKLLGAEGLIQRRLEGYVIAVAPGDVDVGRFELLLEQARDAAGSGDRQAEAAVLRQALGLWHGRPLADVPSDVLHGKVARLGEQRLEALQRRIEADLALGRHGELVSELRELTDRYPLREGLWAQLMTALYRCGRQADALEAFTRARDRLVDELGIEPATELQRVQHAILASDPALAGPPIPSPIPIPSPARRDALVRPAQLPVDVWDFVGRARLVGEAERLLAGDRQVAVVALSGSPGVGKTALAVHAAHRLAERFVDGQLFVDLHGATAGLSPLAPMEVLGRFLRALGADPAAIPAGVEEAGALFRSWVAGRRVLVVLDNAADAAQVAPLLPASPGCGVLVTSRQALTSLEGAAHLRLDVLDPAEAVELVGRVAGRERVVAEAEAAAELASCCGWLPLALRIAGARLAARPAWPVVTLVERLAGEESRLDELELAEGGVRASFQVSYQQLAGGAAAPDRAAAEMFVLLGVLDGPDVGVRVAARLLDADQDTAERALERLVDAHLLETPRPGRYRLHDLLRAYARELASQQRPDRLRATALTRALGFYTAAAWRALAVLRPGDNRLARVDDRWSKRELEFADARAAFAWLEAERANLLAAVRQAAATPGVPSEISVQLAHALGVFHWVRSYWDDWAQANQTALEVAGRLGDRAGQAHALNDLGLAHWRQGRYDQAVVSHERSLILRRELGDRRGEGASLNNLGLVYEWQGRHDQAIPRLRESLAIWRELGDRHAEAISLGNLGNNYGRLGRREEALACQRESLARYREADDRDGLARGLRNLGGGSARLGRCEEAMACLHEGLAIYRELGDRDGQAFCLNDLGIVHRRQGKFALALGCQRKSLAMRRELADAHCEAESLWELGVTLRALGRIDEARAHWFEALAVFERLGSDDAAQVRTLLADLPTSPSH
jgi:DNA-binding SARP family transcriptional activator/DNA-binding transcriptional ArsR family regulator/Flp pilus assembly protein TadD